MQSKFWSPNEIVIEVGSDRNQYLYFRPLNCRLRGKWSASVIKGVSSNTEYGNLPDLPGIQVGIDLETKTIRAADPLGFPQYEHVLREANRIIKPWQGEGRPWDTMVQRNLDENELKTAFWCIADLVWSNKASEVQGSVPDRDKILAMKGKLRIRFGRLNTDNQGNQESPFASKEELDKLRQGPAGKVERYAPGTETMESLQVMTGSDDHSVG